jgi:neutral trehalase
LIEEALWNTSLSIYCHLDPATSRQVLVRNWTGLAPVLFGFAKPERVQETIERCILNPQHFLRPYGLASTAASELLYNQAKRGLYGRAMVSNWQGPVWVLPNVLAVRCLVAHEYKQQAVEISQRVLMAMSKGLKETGKLYENYDAETGHPLWAPQFMSWNVLALEMIQLLE